MEAPLIYAIVVGGCITAFGLRQCISWFSRKHVIYPYILPRIRLLGSVYIGPLSRMQILLQTAYYAGTAVCNILGVKSLNQASSRAGTIAVANLIPLTVGDRFSFAAGMLGVPPRVACRIHNILGWMATVQAFAHVLLSIKQHPIDLKEMKLRFPLVAGLSLLASSLFSLPFVRRASYEIFLKLHYVLGIVALLGLWRHLEPRLSLAKAFLIASMGLLILTKAARWCGFLYRSLLAGKPWPRGKFFPTGGTDGVELRVRVARHWTPKNNQHLYVCVPKVTPGSFMQEHPYCVAWWEYDTAGRLDTVSLLIKPSQGFSSHAQRVPRNAAWKAVAIDGPYGIPIDIAAFGTLVVFATGIGIAAQLPLLKQALEERASDRTPLRRILLVWLIEESSQMDWVQRWMQRVLDTDLQYTRERFGGQELISNAKELENWEEDKLIFRSEVYALHSQGTDSPIGRRTTLFKGKLPDIEAIVKREYKDRFGKILVTVCAEPGTRDRIRSAATKVVGSDMKYQEMDFQPMQEGDLWQLKLPAAETGTPDAHTA